MKFTCERCGKKYATAENPTPGRVYKLKCKACGHVIVVKATAAHATDAAAPRPDAPAAAPAPAAPAAAASHAFDASAHSAATPIADLAPAGSAGSSPPAPHATNSITLEVGTPEPAHVPGNGSPRAPAFESPPDLATEALRGQHALEHTPTRGDSGYVDLFSDVSGIQELPQRPSEDPFMAAARASLPDGYGTGSSSAPDPFADLREDISATSEPQPPRSPPPVPKMPVIPRPRQERSNVPLLLIGAGVAVMVGILAFVLLSSGKNGAPVPAPVAASARPAAAPPAAAPAPPQPAQPQVAQPQVAQPELPIATPAPPAPAPGRSDDAARARAEQKRREREEAQAREEKARAEREARDREAKAQAKAEREARDREAREAKERAAAEREAKAKADREAKAQAKADREAKERAAAEAKERERAARQAAAAEESPAESEGLTQAQIEGVLRSTKPAFDDCIRAARGGDLVLDGRRVMLRLNIQSTGTVTYPTLDDVTLNSTEVGTCLKSAARVMVFPKFRGDTMHVEVPLVMR